MTDVFLSYSREDEQEAARFAKMLKGAGLSVWWDRRIPPGQTWDEVIGKQLGEAKCVVTLWTRTSVDSDWVKEEASRGARRKALVPVLLDEVEPPLGFGRIEAANLASWDGDRNNVEFANFVLAVQALVARPIDVEPEPPVQTTVPRWRWLAGVAAIVLAAIGAGIWLKPGPDSKTGIKQEAASVLVVDANIWKVEVDRKGSVKAAQSFSPESGSADAGEALAERMVDWIASEILPTDTSEPVEIELVVPEDPTKDAIVIRSRPETPLTTYLYVTAGRGKSRVPSQLRPEDLAFVGPEFAIEIAATGYDSVPVPVVVGQAQERTFAMKPLRVKLAVEEFGSRPNRLAAQLTALLTDHQRIEVFGPEALKELKRELERSQDAIGINRAAQVAIRDSLGIDYIVGGSLSGGSQ